MNIEGAINVQTLYVIDTAGRICKKIERPESVLELSDLTSGTYFIRVEMDDSSLKTVRVIKK